MKPELERPFSVLRFYGSLIFSAAVPFRSPFFFFVVGFDLLAGPPDAFPSFPAISFPLTPSKSPEYKANRQSFCHPLSFLEKRFQDGFLVHRCARWGWGTFSFGPLGIVVWTVTKNQAGCYSHPTPLRDGRTRQQIMCTQRPANVYYGIYVFVPIFSFSWWKNER
ncbi:hypothetical protein CEXT_651841 [Caerostris extrusa]|uniref:Cytochrome c biogenesis B n=1 Tax=Caerostris extrusa TaxID=172846 RepID=A0AAV4XA57_CAEEX|nr:hypothetical protein CEXT_651841 [Caerostris extrusa]